MLIQFDENQSTHFDGSNLNHLKIEYNCNRPKMSLKKLLPFSKNPVKSGTREIPNNLNLPKENARRNASNNLIFLRKSSIINYDLEESRFNKIDKNIVIDTNKDIKSKVFYNSIKQINFREIFYNDINPSELSKVNSHHINLVKRNIK